jgi:hypothetical protein
MRLQLPDGRVYVEVCREAASGDPNAPPKTSMISPRLASQSLFD